MQFSPTYIKIQWGIIFFVLAIVLTWTSLKSFVYVYNAADLIYTFSVLGFFLLFYFVYAFIRPDNRLKTTMMTIFLFLFFSFCVSIYCYLVYALNLPLINSTLDYLDSLFGFNAPHLVAWMKTHPIWDRFFSNVYGTFTVQILLIFFYFGFYKNPFEFQRFTLLYMISLFITITIAGLLPAIGTYAWYNFEATPHQLSELEHLLILRKQIISFEGSDSMVTFPSFHTTLALLYAFTFRHESKLILVPLVLLNILIIFSCLSHGGHFLTDIWGGIAIFGVSVWIEAHVKRAVKKYGTISELVTPPLKKKRNPSRLSTETAI